MKRVIVCTDLSEHVRDTYFHYDQKDYHVGDTIYSKHNPIDNDILKAYRKSTGFMDIDSALYITDNRFATWDYKYMYEVDPIGDVVFGYSSCSAIKCQEVVKRLVNTYRDMHTISEEDARNDIILWMSNAYIGDDKNILKLFMHCQYEARGEVEGICTGARVLDKYII